MTPANKIYLRLMRIVIGLTFMIAGCYVSYTAVSLVIHTFSSDGIGYEAVPYAFIGVFVLLIGIHIIVLGSVTVCTAFIKAPPYLNPPEDEHDEHDEYDEYEGYSDDCGNQYDDRN
tara:strand:- start:459 stop:806 length:348 start_codon:yes stop_codon:yes gene_type:complete